LFLQSWRIARRMGFAVAKPILPIAIERER
jgi:hypothetical protein